MASVWLSKPGPIREGFKFQDLYGIHLALSWLEHPSQYQWIRFEAREFLWLDDVVALRTGGTLQLIQIKHVTERPDRPKFTLDDFVEQTATKRSLFEKWFVSWLDATKDPAPYVVQPILYTNKSAANELLAVLSEGAPTKIDPTCLRKSHPDTYSTILTQAGSNQGRVDDFLRALSLQFHRADIEPAEEVLRERAAALRISKEGFSSLKDQVWEWSTRRGVDGQTTQVSLEDIKRACGWRRPEKLNENFPVAEDYVLLGGPLLEGLAAAFAGGGEAEFILADSPGAGKSTFLAKLGRHLEEQNMPCIRHHYYLGPDDRSKHERLASSRTADALIAELAEYSKELVNPSVDTLREILTETAKHLKERGLPLVLILDGLDHVLRTEDAKELAIVLKQLLPSPANCWIVLGTRLIPAPAIRAILADIPEERRLQVPRLDPDDCAAMIRNHPKLQVSERDISSIATRLWRITEGLPLHAHYSLVQLEILSHGGCLHDSLLDQLLPYSGDLEKYYQDMWDLLVPETKILAVLLALAEFVIPREAAGELFQGTPAEFQRGYEHLQPLLKESGSGISLFHASFQEFISNHRDASHYRRMSLRRLISWLESTAPPDLRWRWLNIKRYDLGEADPLIQETDRRWALAALLQGYAPEDVETLLRSSCHAAVERGDYQRALERGMIADYLSNGLRFNDELWADIVSLIRLHQLDQSIGQSSGIEVEAETDVVLLEMATRTDSNTLARICDEFNDRLRLVIRERDLHDYRAEVITSAEHYIFVLSVARTPAKEMFDLIERFLIELRGGLFLHYAESLLDSGQPSNAVALLANDRIPESDREGLKESIAQALLIRGQPHANADLGFGRWAQLYRLVVGKEPLKIQYAWPRADEFPDAVSRFNEHERTLLIAAFRGVWLNSLLAGAASGQESLDIWLAQLPGHRWTTSAAKALAKFGSLSGRDLFHEGEDVCGQFAVLGEVEKIRPGDPSWDDWELWIAWTRALHSILLEVLSLRSTYQKKRVDDAALGALQQVAALTEHDLNRLLLACPSGLLEERPLVEVLNRRMRALETRLEEFPERSRQYLDVAQLARRAGAATLSRLALAGAVSNGLAYGSHKDPFLYELLQSMSFAAANRLPGAGESLDRIAPIVNVIDRVTDRDDTGDLLENFAALCIENGRTASAAAIYSSLLKEERYYLAEGVFGEIAEAGDLGSAWTRALLSTAIDRGSRSRLLRRSEREPLARTIVESLRGIDHDPSLFERETEGEGQSTSTGGGILDGLTQKLWVSHPPEQVSMDQFIAFCSEHRTESSFDKFCMRWYSHWSLQDGQAAYRLLREVLDWPSNRIFGGDLELSVLPAVMEFDGPQEGFEFLIRTAHALHVWNSFYTQADKTERAFEFLLEHCPQRVDEFIRRTLEPVGSKNGLTALPVRRGVQLLVKAGRFDSAKNLLGAAVVVLEQLMGDLQLPVLNVRNSEESLIDAMFDRLYHVHPEVRSRTAVELGKLLLAPESRVEARALIEDRLAKCTLESEALVLLYPVAWAKLRGVDWPIEDLRKSLQVTCSAIDLVLGGMTQ